MSASLGYDSVLFRALPGCLHDRPPIRRFSARSSSVEPRSCGPLGLPFSFAFCTPLRYHFVVVPPLKLVDGTRAAAFTSAAMIAHQVAGKAARDALFLTTFPATALPSVMATAAALSLVAVLSLSRLMVRHSPASLLPIFFGGSAGGLVLEWVLGFTSPAATAITFYLHTALVGPVVMTAFWSLINERFDPHNAKRAVARIAGGGTIGGVLGGLMAWRIATLVALPTMLLVLAALHVACLAGTLFIRAGKPAIAGRSSRLSIFADPTPQRIPVLRMLGRQPFLRNLALLVALGAATSSLLDYLFSVQASAVFGKGAPLLSFFSLFWLMVATISLVVQLTLGQRALEKLGLVVNIAILPGVIIMGGACGLAVPGLFTTAVLRGAEAVERNTLYRSAYELLYTPLSEAQKRSVKALIDVGFDRLGTVAGALITMMVLAVSERHTQIYILGGAVVLALLTLPVTRALHFGYVTALETGLRDGAQKLDLPSLAHVGRSAEETDESAERDNLIQRVELLRPRHAFFAPSGGSPIEIGVIEMPALPGGHGAGPAFDALRDPQALPDGRELLFGDVEATAVTLRNLPLETTTPVTAFLILLLAHKHLHTEALAALCRAAPVMTGQLIDALLDPTMDFVVRRRIPLALSACTSQRAADGLLLGVTDERFEVRYACGRALMKMSDANARIVISRQKIVQAILIEVDRKAPGAAPLEFEDDPSELEGASALVDDLLARDRVDRTLEHVFTILALHLDREPLRMAYRALHHPDVRHRGTALEYLQTILPHDIRDAVWPLVGELAPLPPVRSARDILADLLRATVVQTKVGGERD